jgi:hypothetical protein
MTDFFNNIGAKQTAGVDVDRRHRSLADVEE